MLKRFTPPAHRNLVFSIKQAGVPLGGVLGGLAIPPLIESMGWRLAAVVVAAVCIAATLLTWPFRSRIDPPLEQRMQYRLVSFRLTDILVPLRSLSRGNRLWRASWVGCLLAIAQACLGDVRGDLSRRGAGPVAQHGGSRVRGDADDQHDRPYDARVDRRPRRPPAPRRCRLLALGSAVSTILLGFSTPAWPLWSFVVLAAVAGIAVSGWNGVQIAEVARRSPPELIGETAAGSVILIFMANMLTPVAFAAFVAVTSRYDLAFLVCGAFSLVCLPLLYGMGPQA